MNRFITAPHILPYALPLLISAAVSCSIVYHAWRRRTVPGAIPLLVMSYGVIHWSLCATVSLYQTDLRTLILISDIQGVAHAVVPPAWMVFAMRYTRCDRWLSRRTLALLAIEPILFETLLWTDQWHGLMRIANWLQPGEPVPVHYSTFGIGYWGHVVYVYTLVLIGTVLIIRELVHSYHHLYRGQVAALCVTVSAPWIANMIQLMNLAVPFPYIMLTPLAFGVSNMALAWGFFRYRLLDVVPIAREAVLDSMRDGVVVLDRQGHIVDLNPAAQQMIGQSADRAVGQNVGKVWPAWERLFTGAMPEAAARTIEVTDGNGFIKQYELHLSPIHNRHGLRSGSLLVVLDTTERKRTEEERLKISKLESLSVMAAGIAHDFNNTLVGIIGHLSMAKLDLQPGTPLYERLCLAEEAASHASRLTREMMGFARDELSVREFLSVAEVVYSAALLVPRETDIQRAWEMPEDLWWAEIDARQITQVVQNLLLNAQQAMPRGGIMTIGASNETIDADAAIPGVSLPPGPYVRIMVRDEGTGIPIEIQDKIFDPYFTTKEKGTGLGLTSAFIIMQRHGGAITLSSRPGQGAAFYLYLPARPDYTPPPAQAAPEPAAEPALSGPARGRVLVMDDEPIIRRLAQEGLAQFGYTVTCVNDGLELLQAYTQAFHSRTPFDVVIMDLTIPGGMGGKEAILSLLEIDPDARVIVSSGYTNDPVMMDYTRYGFRCRVVKPYRIRDLAEAVHGVING
jgi:PAS domain S-box-containing protein